MTKGMEEARAIARSYFKNGAYDDSALVRDISTALAARDAEIERLQEALTEIGEGRPDNPVGDPWSFYDDLVAFARRARTAGGEHE